MYAALWPKAAPSTALTGCLLIGVQTVAGRLMNFQHG
jgi:hypothetical protein